MNLHKIVDNLYVASLIAVGVGYIVLVYGLIIGVPIVVIHFIIKFW